MNIEEAKRIINIGLGKEKNLFTTSDSILKASKIVLNELDKKDKVIDMMANELRDTCHFEYMSRKEVKEYFYNKIEIPEEN